jgi:hypothetical protein
MHQLEPDIRHAVLGNAGTIISFRIGAEDAPYLAREFVGQFDEIDLVQLPNYRIYLKLMIDGTPSRPFSARTLNMNKQVQLLAFEKLRERLAAKPYDSRNLRTPASSKTVRSARRIAVRANRWCPQAPRLSTSRRLLVHDSP